MYCANATRRENEHFIRLPQAIGLSAGRNAIVAHAQTLYVMIMDDDVNPEGFNPPPCRPRCPVEAPTPQLKLDRKG